MPGLQKANHAQIHHGTQHPLASGMFLLPGINTTVPVSTCEIYSKNNAICHCLVNAFVLFIMAWLLY
jgi:hypothetical protein